MPRKTRRRRTSILPPYMRPRGDQGWRWAPSPALRQARDDAGGPVWISFDLRHSDGRWMTYEEAVRFVLDVQNPRVEAWRAGQAIEGGPMPTATPADARTFSALRARYMDSHAYRDLAPRTRKDYAADLMTIGTVFSDAPLTEITPALVSEYYEKLRTRHGTAQSARIMRVFRLVMNYAVKSLYWLPTNPVMVEIVKAEPRLRLWSQEELTAMIRTADALGLPSIADAIVLGLYTAQRRADLLAIRSLDFDDAAGGFRIQQQKTQARVLIPPTPHLRARLALMRTRQAARTVTTIDTLIMTEQGEPYNPNGFYFGKLFGLVRLAASGEAEAGTPAWTAFVRQRKMDPAPVLAAIERLRHDHQAPLAAVPSLTSAQFKDLRDTAITRYAEAGCSLPEISAISGHTLRSIHSILRHYLVLTDNMAGAAVAKLVDHIEAQGWEY